jgi:hypothetical protein
VIFRIVLPYLLRALKSLGTTALTPVLEKNVVKTLGHASPIVVSMSRLIAMAFAAVMLREFWRSGINGWPDATLGIATVLALPLMSNLERANPDEVLAVTRLLLARFGGVPSGPVIPSGAVVIPSEARDLHVQVPRNPEPSKFDDHRAD